MTSLQSTPDVEQDTACESNCCSCNQANAEERKNAQRLRHFCINGDITVTEDISFHEVAEAVEASEGKATKDSRCVLTNIGQTELPGICLIDTSGCPDADGGLSSGAPHVA